MANDVVITVGARDRSGPLFAAITNRVDGLGGRLAELGTAAAAAGGMIVSKLKAAMDASVEAASNLNESVNAVEKVFGTSAIQIKRWGETNANAFGLSRRAFNELATPLGAILKNAGLSLQAVTAHTIDLTKRAADMASVFNTDVADALGAIQAGLRGEQDPLERYGVSLSAAKVEAEALAETHKKTAKELSTAELMTARLNIIMAQTNDTAGDFQQTSDGLANSTRILTARNEELQARIGAGLMPAYIKLNEVKLRLVETIEQHVIPKVKELYEKYWPGLRDYIQDKVIPTLADLKDRYVEPVKDSLDRMGHSIEAVKQHWDRAFGGDHPELMALKVMALHAVEGITILGYAMQATAGYMVVVIDTIKALVKWLEQLAKLQPNFIKPLLGPLGWVGGGGGGGGGGGPTGGGGGGGGGGTVRAYQHGGRVPGLGPQLAVVHGGETVLPAGRGGETTVVVELRITGDSDSFLYQALMKGARTGAYKLPAKVIEV